MAEGGRAVVLDEKVPDPREGVADQHRLQDAAYRQPAVSASARNEQYAEDQSLMQSSRKMGGEVNTAQRKGDARGDTQPKALELVESMRDHDRNNNGT